MSKKSKKRHALELENQAAKDGFVLMKFEVDMRYNTDIIYTKGVHEVPVNMVDRWLKRGGVIVGDHTIVENQEVAIEQEMDKDETENPEIVEEQ